MGDEKHEVEELPEKGSLFAKLDQVHSAQDYAPFGACVRLIGITLASFESARFNQPAGCWTFLIDLGWRDLLDSEFGWRLQMRSGLCGLDTFDWDFELSSLWVRIDYRLTQAPTGSYAYALFSDQEPRYLVVDRVDWSPGPDIDPLPAAPKPITYSSSRRRGAVLTAFNVGQGMCSLISDGETGYLIDVGAGTPVRRSDYRQGAIRNDLAVAVRASGLVSAIVSHPDSDHWRLLDWDPSMLRAVQAVYLPDGVPALAFKSPAVKPKVVAMKDAKFSIGDNGTLYIFRAEPSRPDRNGDCLVADAVIDGKRALLPGDYVYDRMLNDRRRDSAIQRLASKAWDAVVVPHHGDSESALSVVQPIQPDLSIAFFSAGTHSGYKHPTLASLDNHQKQGFSIVDRHGMRDIKGCQLLP